MKYISHIAHYSFKKKREKQLSSNSKIIVYLGVHMTNNRAQKSKVEAVENL